MGVSFLDWAAIGCLVVGAGAWFTKWSRITDFALSLGLTLTGVSVLLSEVTLGSVVTAGAFFAMALALIILSAVVARREERNRAR